jgi:hypothetical protein
LIVLAGRAGMSNAAESGKKSNSNAQSGDYSLAAQDLMNPDAYMKDLATRMDPADKKLLLQGVDESKTSPASKVPAAQTAPRGSKRQASSTAAKQTTPPASPTTVSNAAATPTPSTTLESGSPMPSSASGTPSQTANTTDLVWKPATPASPTVQTTPSRPAEHPSDLPAAAASPVPATSSAPVGDGASVVGAAQAASGTVPSTRAETGTLPVHTAQNNTSRPMAQGPVSIERELVAGGTGLTLWNEPELVSQAARAQGAGAVQPKPQAPEPEGPWTLGGDLEKYRAHAVKDGSRSSGESLKKALERAGMAVGDGVNVFLLGYASDRAKPFRENDGKGLFQEPGKVPAQAGATIANLCYGLYSIVDLATLNALPDPNKPVYRDNNPLVRPLIFTGRTIGGIWKTTEEVGNAVTWGLFDNVTGCVGLVIEDLVEFIKHAGEAVTNVARAPLHLAAGKKKHEGSDQAMDWVLLVPLELASNAVEMKGFSNMQDYKTAFADKGVIGSVLEFGGSTYLVYRAVDELTDKHKKNQSNQNQSQGQNQTQQPGGSTTPETPTTPPAPAKPVWPAPPDDSPAPVPIPVTSDVEWYFTSDGTLIQ